MKKPSPERRKLSCTLIPSCVMLMTDWRNPLIRDARSPPDVVTPAESVASVIGLRATRGMSRIGRRLMTVVNSWLVLLMTSSPVDVTVTSSTTPATSNFTFTEA